MGDPKKTPQTVVRQGLMDLSSAERTRALLAQLSPRANQALRLRVLEGRSAPECAGFFGIDTDAFGLMLLRATRELEAADQGASPPAPDPDIEHERGEASALERGLAGGASFARTDALKKLGADGPELLAYLAAQERVHESSPAFKRETLIRRVLVGVVLLLTAFFYFRAKTPPQPRPTAPSARPRSP